MIGKVLLSIFGIALLLAFICILVIVIVLRWADDDVIDRDNE